MNFLNSDACLMNLVGCHSVGELLAIIWYLCEEHSFCNLCLSDRCKKQFICLYIWKYESYSLALNQVL